jgi:hypothetical protein
MEIAKTIVQQVIALDPWAFGAYGATKLFEIPECSKYAGGLMFTVNGKKHKGNVLIFLKWSDVYKIVFMSEDGVPVKEVDEVYCDMLVDVLDFIEFGDRSIRLNGL